MERISRILIALSCLLCAARTARAQEPAQDDRRIVWITDLPTALARAAVERKPLVVIFVASWCSACADFENAALASPAVNALSDRFIWVKLDVERNISLVRANEIRATPRTDFRDPDGKTLVRISGALPAMEFRAQLDRFLAAPKSDAGRPARDIDGSSFTPLSETPGGFRGASICYSNVGYGPLRLGSQSPFQALRYGIDPRTPSTLAEGQWEVHESETWINNFSYNAGKYLLDYEMLDTRLSVAYGVMDELELELEFENRSGFGGIMDRFINAFHRTFGLSDADRHLFPRNQFQIQAADSKGNTAISLDNSDQGSFSNGLLLTVQQNLTCGSEYLPALAYALTVRANLDNKTGITGQYPFEPQLSLTAAKSVGDFYGYASLAFGYFGSEHLGGIKFRPGQWSGLIAAEWRFVPSMSLVLQYLISQGEVYDLNPFSSASNEITLGWKWELAERTVFEFGLIENIINFDNSPDFGIHAGITFRF